LKRHLVNNNRTPPLVFLNIASKGFRFGVSLLDATVADSSVVVDSEGLVCDKKAEIGSRKAKDADSLADVVLRRKSVLPNEYYTLIDTFCQGKKARSLR
jgi:hypothetical protein